MPKKYFKIIPAVYLFLLRDNKILLLKRQNTGYQDGNYSLIAGHLDGNETVTEAMCREAKEEANLDIYPENMEVVHAMHRMGTDSERIDFFLLPKTWQGKPKIMESKKCAELKWFPLNALPSNLVPEVEQAIVKIQNKIFYSEMSWK